MPVRLYRILFFFSLLALVLLACQITLQTTSPTSAPLTPAPKTLSPTPQPATAVAETAIPVQPTAIASEAAPNTAAPTGLATQQVILPVVPSGGGETPSRFAFELQPGSPQVLPNFAHPEKGCDWLGVAGQVFDAEQQPINGLVIRVAGSLEGKEIFLISLTGVEMAYGEGGYEVVLANHTVESQSSLSLQVYSATGEPLSAEVPIDTSADCTRNLILVNFIAAEPQAQYLYYFPITVRR